MVYVYIGLAAIVLIGAVVVFFEVKRIGKNEERLDQTEQILANARKANRIRNLSDDDIGKLRDKYE